jgi:signal transduction histidine kinase
MLNQNKIAHRFTFLVITAITCIFLLAIGYEYYSERRAVERQVAYKLEYTADIISISVSDPVWDYDYSGIELIGNSLFKDIEVGTLIIRDDVSGVVYDHEMTGIPYKKENISTRSKAVTYDGETIGSVTLGLTDYYAKQMMYKRIQIRLVQLLMSIVTLVVVVYFISFQITKPISLLEANARRIAKGEKRLTLPPLKDDEIGHLASSLNEMGEIIEVSSTKLHTINNSLEEKVTLRTEELLVKNNELNRTLKTLKETQAELLQTSKIQLTTRLVSGVAHEINTPLGLTITIVTFINGKVRMLEQLINNGHYSKEKANELLHEIEEASVSLESNLKRVSQLMEHFRQLMLEDQNQSATRFNVFDQLNKIHKTLILALMEKNIRFEIVCSEELVVKSYPSALLQIVTQLTENALKHGFEDKEEGIIRVTCEKRNNQLQVVFSDNGHGFSTEVCEHIFVPFYKADTKVEGSGLGLSIVENIVNVHLGGQIRCISERDVGTTFEIQFPVE